MYPQLTEDEYDLAWLEAERDLAISRWENLEYWQHWDDESVEVVRAKRLAGGSSSLTKGRGKP